MCLTRNLDPKSPNSAVKHFLLLFTLTLLFTTALHAQQHESEIKIGTSFLINPGGLDKDLPFWMHANQDGVVDQYSANAFTYIDVMYRPLWSNNLKIETGGRVITRYSYNPLAFINTLYAKTTFFNTFVLSAGKFIDPLALKEDELSTGSFMISRNAKPIPKIALHTDGFVSVPGTAGIVRYNAFFGHGWFEKDRYVQNAYLHQKYFYLGIKYAFFDAVGGIVHNVQWAGNSVGTPDRPGRGRLPAGWDTFFEVVFAKGSRDENAPGGEQSNAVGNSVAAYDFNLGLFFKHFDMRAYRVFFLEDKVSTRFRSPWDGVWGLTVKPKSIPLIQNVIWEHINTKRQDSFDFEPWGTASYYNNFIYLTGWTHHRRVIGNPLLLSNGHIYRPVYNNIIIGHHVGLAGKLPSNFDYTLKYTFTRNYGIAADQIIQRLPASECGGGPITCGILRPLQEVKKLNQSLIFSIENTFPGNSRLRYGLSIAADWGELYGDRVGLGFNLEYSLK